MQWDRGVRSHSREDSKETGGESTNLCRISEVKATERDGVTEEECQAKVSSKVRQKSLKARKGRAQRC